MRSYLPLNPRSPTWRRFISVSERERRCCSLLYRLLPDSVDRVDRVVDLVVDRAILANTT